MPPKYLFDLSEIDLTCEPVFSKKEILEINPQRYEMQHLDGILWYDKDKRLVLGYKDVTENEFWVRGHIPERPLMPGVIMIEAAAQISSFFVQKMFTMGDFIGFAGIEKTKFRATVEPGDRLYLLSHITKFRSRKFTSCVQGVVNGKMAFETVISGMNV